MQVVFHLGAHCTDEDRLIKGLLKNRDRLAGQGIVVPGPGRYRAILRETIASLRGAAATDEIQEVLLDALMDEDRAERVILSHEHFLCIPRRVVTDGALYPMAGMKLNWLANLFPDAEAEFTMALRNPATLIPALVAQGADLSYETVMEGADPLRLRWRGVIARMLSERPEAHLTLWCNEDTPLIWTEVLREVAGVGPDQPVSGGYDLAVQILTEEGSRQLKAHLQANPPQSDRHRRDILQAFYADHARPEEVEIEVSLPGWTNELMEAMTAAYEADVAEIAEMPGVTFLSA